MNSESTKEKLAQDVAQALLQEHGPLIGRFLQSLGARLTAATTARPSIEEKFWARIARDADDRCWLWKGHLNESGYGIFNAGSKRIAAHRFAYELCVGAIPPEHAILHSCDTPGCCNPAHLRAGTNRENIRDKVEKQRHYRGERHHNALLTAADVHHIRQSTQTHAVLAEMFGVKPATIAGIRNRRSWKTQDGTPPSERKK